MPLPSIQDLMNQILPASRASYVAPTSYNVRGVPVTDADLATLRHVLFAEISNRASDKQALEARTIVNTALNRIPQYQAKGRVLNVSQVLQEPNQYQGYGSPEYQRIASGQTKPTDQQKLNSIDSVLSEVRSGKFKDNTNGSVFYKHNATGQIQTSRGALYKQSPKITDLTRQ